MQYYSEDDRFLDDEVLKVQHTMKTPFPFKVLKLEMNLNWILIMNHMSTLKKNTVIYYIASAVI